MYNYKNMSPLYCEIHKVTDMINVKSKKCIYKDCIRNASYNYENNPPLYCEMHKLTDMIRVYIKLCLNCNYTQANTKYDNYCFAINSDITYSVNSVDFPKITSENIIGGISNVKYKIMLSKIESFIKYK